MKRVIKADERKLWRQATRDVRRNPATSQDDPADTPLPALPNPVAAATKVEKPQRLPATPSPKPTKPPTLDGETARRLKTKAARPQARLDLHGMTEATAHRALTAFIEASAAENRHLVLVITGKGRQGAGILRRALPLWLEAPRLKTLVLALAPAFTVDGGDGAFYIHLKRHSP